MYKVNNHQEAIDTIKKIDGNEFIMQEFVKSSVGKDLRLNVVGNKVVATMKRLNEDDFRANITNGGKWNSIIQHKNNRIWH